MGAPQTPHPTELRCGRLQGWLLAAPLTCACAGRRCVWCVMPPAPVSTHTCTTPVAKQHIRVATWCPDVMWSTPAPNLPTGHENGQCLLWHPSASHLAPLLMIGDPASPVRGIHVFEQFPMVLVAHNNGDIEVGAAELVRMREACGR